MLAVMFGSCEMDSADLVLFCAKDGGEVIRHRGG